MSARVALVLSLALVAGCSSYDPEALRAGKEYDALRPLEGPAQAHRILIVPVDEARVEGDAKAELRGSMRFDARAFEAELQTALERVFGKGDPKSPQIAIADSQGDPADQAFQDGYDLVVRARIKRWDATFLETNGWWYPNALFLAWYFWPIGPHWVIADEVYGVDCELSLDVFSAGSERSLPLRDRHRRVVVRSEPGADQSDSNVPPPAPSLALSDLQRGLDWFGTWDSGDLDPDQWQSVGTLIEPYARRHAAVRVGLAVRDAVDAFEAKSPTERRKLLAATHAVVVGVSAYPDAPCQWADKDAEAFSKLLTGELAKLPPEGEAGEPLDDEDTPEGRKRRRWAPEKNVALLVNGQAKPLAIKNALEAMIPRAQPQDRLVVYFAGRGERLSGKKTWLEALALHPYGGGPPITLAELSKLVNNVPAQHRLIVLDVDFNPGQRGAGKKPAKQPSSLVGRVRKAFLDGAESGAVILATSLGRDEEVQSYEEQGLLTQYLIKGLQGAADRDGDGLSYEDLTDYLTRHVVHLSEVALASPQRPTVVTQGVLELDR